MQGSNYTTPPPNTRYLPQFPSPPNLYNASVRPRGRWLAPQITGNNSRSNWNKRGKRNRGKQENMPSLSLSRTESDSDSVSSHVSQSDCVYVCRGCNKSYDYYKSRNKICGRVPQILPCGHTLCQECIDKSLESKNQVDCTVCQNSVLFNKQSTFYNHFLMGHIACSKLTEVNKGPPIKLSSVTQKAGPELTYNNLKRCGFNDCNNAGTISCVNCFSFYCDKCDEEAHKNEDHEQIHSRNPVEKVSYEVPHCQTHKDSKKDVLCKECELTCCCYCFMNKHKGHTFTNLRLLEDAEEAELMEDFKLASEMVDTVEKSLQSTEKNNEAFDIEKEITQQFADIHAKLYLIEKQLIRRVKLNFSNMNDGDTVVSSFINSARNVLECVKKREERKFDLRTLHSKLKEIKNISVPTNVCSNGTVKLSVDENIKHLENCFKLVTTCGHESPLNYPMNLDRFNVSSCPVLEKSDRRIENVEEPSPSPSQIRYEPSMNENIVKIVNKFSEKVVRITYIHSLNCIYVQPKTRSNEFALFEEDLSQMAQSEDEVRHFILGQCYLAPTSQENNKWGRVTLLSKIGDTHNRKYQVEFIDFGYRNVINKEDLRYISRKLADVERFAVKCKLYNPLGTEWDGDSYMKVMDILTIGREVVMLTKIIHSDIQEVELLIGDSSGDLYPITQMILEKQVNTEVEEETSSRTSLGSFKVFDNTETFTVGQSYNVLMKYALDPWHIFIQKSSYDGIFDKLVESLENYYKNSGCDILFPIEGSDVVVFYPSDDNGNWHRGRILNISKEDSSADVVLLDWGKQVSVKWSDLRKLCSHFVEAECLVVCARLADVYPKSDNKWVDENGTGATTYLEQHCNRSNVLKMLVSKSEPLEIALFVKRNGFDENINALLVTNDHAVSTGKLSSATKWPWKITEEKSDETEFFPINKSFSDTDDDDAEGEVEGMKLGVKLIRFVDPSRIYVSVISFRKSDADQLYEELQIHYKQGEQNDKNKKWKVNDRVAVLHEEEGDYYRGIIESIENNKYSVYLMDKGEHLEVVEKDLRMLHNYFATKFPNVVIQCCLANIKPAGGSQKWSNVAIEWFQRLFNKQKNLFIQKIDHDEMRSSIPVTMWYCTVIQGGALEPSSYKYYSIEMKAVNAGIAFQINKSPKKVKKDEPFIAMIEVHSNDSLPESSNSVIEIEPESPLRDNFCRSWLPPQPFENSIFHAYVTCVEGNGYIYVREVQLQDAYIALEVSMTEYFNSIPMERPPHLNVNRMITISSDGKWFRGLILEVVDEETVRALMIDFGSDHLIRIDNIHNKIMYPEIPSMTAKIKLHDVHSRSKWNKSNIDYILKKISEYSKIVIRSDSSAKIPSADIYDENDICLNDEIVKVCPNLFRLSSSSQKPEQDQKIPRKSKWPMNSTCFKVNERIPNYTFVRPEITPGELVSCEITSVFDYNTVSLFYKGDQSKESEFQRLAETIQKEAPNLEILEDIDIGTPCICQYSNDNLWYRAIIFKESLQSGCITVFYVDYGNFETVDLSNVRKTKREWLDFPAYMSIAQVVYKTSGCEQHLIISLRKLVGQNTKIEVVSDNPFRIYVYDNEGNELKY